MTLEQELGKYEKYKGESINTIEKLGDALTGLDERQDYTNKLLMQILIAQGVQPLPPGEEPQIWPPPSYPRVQRFPLDTARAAPGEPVLLPGNVIAAYTDGSYEGIFVRIEDQGNDAIPLSEINPYYHPGPFSQFYLETTQQTGKYLRLVVASRAFLSISDLSVHIETAQKVGIYLQPEWAALQGLDKNFKADNDNATWAQQAIINYTVTAGKNLYICGVSWLSIPLQDTDYDHFFNTKCTVGTSAAVIVSSGGLNGGSVTLPRPAVIPGETAMIAYVANYANFACYICVTLWGYEL